MVEDIVKGTLKKQGVDLMSFCINLKQKMNRTLYCKKLKKPIVFKDCSDCPFKEYKSPAVSGLSNKKADFKAQQCELKNNNLQNHSNLRVKSIKKKSYELAKKEKERFSIIYPDLTKFCHCGSKLSVAKNEVFEGAYRQRSMKMGMVAPFCRQCHDRFHNDIMFNLYYKVLFEKEFLKTHTRDEFIETFGQDYIFKLEQKKPRS